MTFLRTYLTRFARDTRGNVTLEALIWLPLILTVLAATFSLHDAFRYKSLNTKAAYTISDAISRETDPIDNDYLDGMVDLLEFMTRSNSAYSLRVSLVRYDAQNARYDVEWSQTRGIFTVLEDVTADGLDGKLPNMLHNERVIVVETETDYVPPFIVPGLNEEDMFYTFSFTRPRFAPKITWSNG